MITELGTVRYGFFASSPSDAALSKPTKAKMAITIPGPIPALGIPLRARASAEIPFRAKTIAKSTRMIVIETASRTRDTRADNPMLRYANQLATATSIAIISRMTTVVPPGSPIWVKKAPR